MEFKVSGTQSRPAWLPLFVLASNNLGFASSENSTMQGPSLTLFSTTTAVPEPATTTLAVLGVGGLVMRRRRAA